MFICNNCGYGSSSWLGRCPSCGLWNTLVERKDLNDKKQMEEIKEIKTDILERINFNDEKRLKTGVYEFDRVLGGGLVIGEVILLTGEPGVGKSTLVLQTCQNLKTLYIAGEESASQVKRRAQRLGVNLNNFLVTEDLQIEGIVKGIKNLKNKIDVVLVDSIQTLYSKNIDSPAGSINQLKEVTFQLIQLAKKEDLIIILIGHVTKEGLIAGPKTLEHMVDCVLNFE
ncbi:MAG: ATPase domain-containing protein, partial [Microgenomates group bacterium]